MFEWKNVELSPLDYENYVINEDEAQMRADAATVTELEWATLYRQAQTHSTANRAVKKHVLVYEGNLKRLLGQLEGDLPQKDALAAYERHSNELHVHLSALSSQLALLNIRNLSTAVEFTLSRLLALEEHLLRALCRKQAQLQDLETRNNLLEMGKTTQLCPNCLENLQKNRNKFLVKQVMAVETSAGEVEESAAREASAGEERRAREAALREDHEYELQRYKYLNSVEEVLRNRERTLRCNSAPLQGLLSEYLTQILEMLEGSQLVLAPKNLIEYDRVNQSYETIDGMKALINTQDFYQKVSVLIEKPYQNLVENIEKYVNRSTQNKSIAKVAVHTQTSLQTEANQIKALQKVVGELSSELQSLRQSKSRSEVDMINNLDSLHRLEMKYMEVVSRNKSLESENRKLEGGINELRNELTALETAHRSNQTNIIDVTANQKAYLLKELKLLEAKLQYYESLSLGAATTSKQIQTDEVQPETENERAKEEETMRELKKLAHGRSSKKDKKRISLRMDDIRALRPPQSSKFEPEGQEEARRDSLDTPTSQRNDTRPKTIKIYTISPLSPLNDTLIHRASSRKISAKKDTEVDALPHAVRLSLPNTQKPGIKKVPQSNRKHAHQISELTGVEKRRKRQKMERLSIVTGRKIGPNDLPYAKADSKPHLSSKEPSLQFLSNQEDNFVVKINHPMQQGDLAAALLEREGVAARPGLRDELDRLVKFSIRNLDSLVENNIIGMICDMRFEKARPPPRQEKPRDSLSIAEGEAEAVEPTVEVECSKIGRRCLEIFFGMEEAEKYEHGTGIWAQVDSLIVVDNNFSGLCDRIQGFFDSLKDKRPMLYQESLLFLEKPFYFCRQVQGKDYETRQVTIFRESLRSFTVERNWIKKLFRRLLRLHKLLHKNCHHVQKFLQILGFFKQ